MVNFSYFSIFEDLLDTQYSWQPGTGELMSWNFGSVVLETKECMFSLLPVQKMHLIRGLMGHSVVCGSAYLLLHSCSGFAHFLFHVLSLIFDFWDLTTKQHTWMETIIFGFAFGITQFKILSLSISITMEYLRLDTVVLYMDYFYAPLDTSVLSVQIFYVKWHSIYI